MKRMNDETILKMIKTDFTCRDFANKIFIRNHRLFATDGYIMLSKDDDRDDCIILPGGGIVKYDEKRYSRFLDCCEKLFTENSKIEYAELGTGRVLKDFKVDEYKDYGNVTKYVKVLNRYFNPTNWRKAVSVFDLRDEVKVMARSDENYSPLYIKHESTDVLVMPRSPLE